MGWFALTIGSIGALVLVLPGAAPGGSVPTPLCFGKEATIVGTGADDDLVGTPDVDVIVGLGGRDVIRGRGGADLICAGPNQQPGATATSIRREQVFGGDGDDRIRGGSGFDQLFGGSGDDRISLGPSPTVSGVDEDGTYFVVEYGIGGPGADRLVGGRGFNVMSGGGGNDVLRAWPGSEGSEIPFRAELLGGHGEDLLVGGAGGDYLGGGPGDDVQRGGGGADALAESNTGYRSNGGGHDVMLGGPGNDYLETRNGNDDVRGGAGDDEVLGSNGPDRLFGGAGDDQLDGHDGDDALFGGRGIDVAMHSVIGTADDSATRRLYVDLAEGVATGFGTDALHGIEGAEGQSYLFDAVGADVLLGDSGPNTFSRLGRGDRVDGRAGSDFVCLCPDEVSDEKGAVIDLRNGIARRHRYQVPLESIERAQGTVGPDTLIGSAKPNHLDGGAGDDVLKGWEGDDYLDGGEGVDILDGSSGGDTCVHGETVKECEVVPVANPPHALADKGRPDLLSTPDAPPRWDPVQWLITLFTVPAVTATIGWVLWHRRRTPSSPVRTAE